MDKEAGWDIRNLLSQTLIYAEGMTDYNKVSLSYLRAANIF